MKIAIQKNGRLTDRSLDLLRACGIDLPQPAAKLVLPATNADVQVLFLRDDDIVEAVSTGVADAGIVGQNVVSEQQGTDLVCGVLGYGRCRVCIALPRERVYTSPESLRGLRIATSYPRVLAEWLKVNHISAEVHTISGSVEIAPGIGLADAICDIVSSGSTLLANGLREVAVVMSSEAVLVRSPSATTENAAWIDRLLSRMDAVGRARNKKYVLMNIPCKQVHEAAALIPGLRSPTVLPLEREGWCGMHAVVPSDEVWNILDALKELGAEGILVTTIEALIP